MYIGYTAVLDIISVGLDIELDVLDGNFQLIKKIKNDKENKKYFEIKVYIYFL